MYQYALSRGRRRPAAITASVLALAAALTGCGALGNTTATSSAPTTRQSLVVGVNPNVAVASLYVAMDHNLFAAQGLTVRLVKTTGGSAAVPALIGGAYDITSTNDGSAILARDKGVPVEFVADAASAQPGTYTLDALPDSSVRSITDLPGKTVGISSLNDPPYLALRTEMADHALDPNSVHWDTVAFANAQAELTAHRIDAAIEAEPFRTQTAETLGARPIVDIFGTNSGYAGFPIAAYVATDKFAKGHPAAIAAFQRAMSAAANLTKNQAVVRASIRRHITTITDKVAALINLPTYPTDLDPTRLARVATMLGKASLIPPNFNIKQMIIPESTG